MVPILSPFNRGVEKILKPVLSILLLGITVFLVFHVFCRFTNIRAISWAEELSIFSIITIVYYGSVLCVPLGKHVTMDAVVTKMGPRTRKVFDMISAICGIACAVALSIGGCMLCKFVSGTGQASAGLRLPMWIMYLNISIACILMAIEYLESAISCAIQIKNPPALGEFEGEAAEYVAQAKDYQEEAPVDAAPQTDSIGRA